MNLKKIDRVLPPKSQRPPAASFSMTMPRTRDEGIAQADAMRAYRASARDDTMRATQPGYDNIMNIGYITK